MLLGNFSSADFARRKGSKDKKKRIGKNSGNIEQYKKQAMKVYKKGKPGLLEKWGVIPHR